MNRRLPALLLALLALALVALAGAMTPAATAQQPVRAGEVRAADIERVGGFDVALDRRLARLLDDDPLVLTADTLVAATDTLRGPVLVLDATLILEGTVTGDLVLVDAGAFVRPGATVAGDLVNIGGGLYRSELSRVRGVILDEPTAGYRVVREGDRVVIEARGAASRLVLDGVLGLHAPAYDRVNGVTLLWGARYRLPTLGDIAPSVHGQVGWLTERGDPTWAASVRIRRFGTSLEAGHGVGWVTNDDWIRDDLENALNYAWDGDDFRDYHSAERSWVRLARAYGDEEKSFYAVLSLTGEVEDAESLEAGGPWHLWGEDTIRPNPAIDEGRITSATLRLDMDWRGRLTAFEGGVEYEAAREWVEGESTFDRVAAEGDWAMSALADHTLEIEFFVQQPLGDVLPRQRWSFVGGSGTLQTVEFARYYGDRVVFVESRYGIPLPDRVALPILGAPELELVHGAGMAWIEGQDRSFEQELGARLEFFGLYVRYMVDPADPGNSELDVGLSWPFGETRPWQR